MLVGPILWHTHMSQYIHIQGQFLNRGYMNKPFFIFWHRCHTFVRSSLTASDIKWCLGQGEPCKLPPEPEVAHITDLI